MKRYVPPLLFCMFLGFAFCLAELLYQLSPFTELGSFGCALGSLAFVLAAGAAIGADEDV